MIYDAYKVVTFYKNLSIKIRNCIFKDIKLRRGVKKITMQGDIHLEILFQHLNFE